MKLILKALPIILLGSILFFVFASGFLFYLSYQSLPNYNKTLFSNDVRSKILIQNDLYAIPHITGTNNEETFFGLGYVHAQERLWQMTYLKRLSQGRLSEISGSKTIPLDLFMKSLDLQDLAKNIYQNMPPDVQQVLSFYSKGVNFRLNEIQTKGLGRGSPEFFFQKPEVTPWSPIDSLTVLKLLEFMSSNKALMEISLTSLLFSKTVDEKISHLISDASLLRSKLNAVGSQIVEQRVNKNTHQNFDNDFNFLAPNNGGFTSNVFAADGSRSASKKSLLSTNLFLPLSSPSIWMLAHLNLTKTSVVGATIPGVPIIFSGKNNNLAWGSSFSYIDDQDLYFEKLNPKNEEEYLSPTGYKKFDIKKKLIKVKNNATISYSIKRTENRVIIPHQLYKMQSIVPEGYGISLAWTGHKNNDTTLETFMNLMASENIDDLKNNILKNNSFNLIFIVADETNIASFFIGNAPKRKKTNETKGQVITPGWKTENQWRYKLERKEDKLSIPFGDNGFIINTNNKFQEEKYPNHMSFNWGDEQRLLRATKMISSREFHTSESFKELQNDFVSEPARTLLPLMGKELWFQYDNDPDDINSIKNRSLELLTNWNGDMTTSSPEALIYSTWIETFKRMLIGDELSYQFFLSDIISPLFLEKVLRNYENAGIWCDIKHSEKIETCAELSRKSLTKSLRQLKEDYGSDVDSWNWGKKRRIKHPSYSADEILIPKFLREVTSEIPGSKHTLNSIILTEFAKGNEAKASSFKMIIDFSSPNKNMFILPSGQSGHLLSKHYDDQTSLWKKGEYLFLSGSSQMILGGSKGKIVINPLLAK